MTTWAGGEGLRQWYRLEAQRLLLEAEEIWVMKGPEGVTTCMDAKGGAHWVQPDGCFYLKRPHALTLLNQIGWSRVA